MDFYGDGDLGGFGDFGMFGVLEGLKEDAIEFGILAASGLAGAAAAKYIVKTIREQAAAGKALSFLGTSVDYVAPLVPVALGVAGGGWLLRSGKLSNPMAQQAVKGAAVGLASYGIAALVFGKLVTDPATRAYNPYSLAGCAGCGGYAGYSPAGYLASAGPVTVEEGTAGLNAAGPVTVEEGTAGLGRGFSPVSIEEGTAGMAALIA